MIDVNHDRAGSLKDVFALVADVDGQPPQRGIEPYISTAAQKGPQLVDLLAGDDVIEGDAERRGTIGILGGGVNAGAGLDHQFMMWFGYLKPLDVIKILVAEVAQPARRMHAQDKRGDPLWILGGRPQPHLIIALGDRQAV